jgi:hypothetical protein
MREYTSELRSVDGDEESILVEIHLNQPVIGYWKLVRALGFREERTRDTLEGLHRKGLVVACLDGWVVTSEGERVVRTIIARGTVDGVGHFFEAIKPLASSPAPVPKAGGKGNLENRGLTRRPAKGLFIDLGLKNPFHVDFNHSPSVGGVSRRW